MAFGPPPGPQKVKNMVVEDQLWKAYVNSEEVSGEGWKCRWSWIVEDYAKLAAKLKEASDNSIMLKGLTKPEPLPIRQVKPYPETTTGMYGWIANKPEFKLERYGPDIMLPNPQLPEYNLNPHKWTQL